MDELIKKKKEKRQGKYLLYMGSGRYRLLRDVAEWFESKETRLPVGMLGHMGNRGNNNPTYVTNKPKSEYQWCGREDKTIFFYHWSCMDKGCSVLHSIDEFIKKMDEYGIPTMPYQREFIKALGSQFCYIACKPNTKELVFRNSWKELETALNYYREGKL